MNRFIIHYAFIDDDFVPLSTGMIHAYTENGRDIKSCDITKGSEAPRDGVITALVLRWHHDDANLPTSFISMGSGTGIVMHVSPRSLLLGETCTPDYRTAAIFTNHLSEMAAVK